MSQLKTVLLTPQDLERLQALRRYAETHPVTLQDRVRARRDQIRLGGRPEFRAQLEGLLAVFLVTQTGQDRWLRWLQLAYTRADHQFGDLPDPVTLAAVGAELGFQGPVDGWAVEFQRTPERMLLLATQPHQPLPSQIQLVHTNGAPPGGPPA